MDELWTGAQFMTEIQGGSDVALNTMTAEKVGDHWELSGDKWFCSNASADVSLALARPENAPPEQKVGIVFDSEKIRRWYIKPLSNQSFER